MEKNYTSYLHRQPIFFQTIAKIKTNYKNLQNRETASA